MPVICIGICIGICIDISGLAVCSQFAESSFKEHERSQAVEDSDTDTSTAIINVMLTALAFIK
jgi:hypothetical protein